jgi:riboflavin-specific deaminase-like protein
MKRLLPDCAETTIDEQMRGFDPAGEATAERPHVYSNFAVTVDGRATISGRSGPIGTKTDLAMLMALRAGTQAVMIGAGTMRVERYGRLLPDQATRAARERRGLPHDPLAVIVSGRLDLPWDAGLFTCGGGRVLIFTASDAEPPETATPVRVVRHPDGVDLAAAMRHLRTERGIEALLCEGGPHLHGQLLAAGLVDELFVTLGAKLAGGAGPGLVEQLVEGKIELDLRWLLSDGGELFARYAVAR